MTSLVPLNAYSIRSQKNRNPSSFPSRITISFPPTSRGRRVPTSPDEEDSETVNAFRNSTSRTRYAAAVFPPDASVRSRGRWLSGFMLQYLSFVLHVRTMSVRPCCAASRCKALSQPLPLAVHLKGCSHSPAHGRRARRLPGRRGGGERVRGRHEASRHLLDTIAQGLMYLTWNLLAR